LSFLIVEKVQKIDFVIFSILSIKLKYSIIRLLAVLLTVYV
jgi:hypothetical protein